jgi:hypothetical protein
MITVNVIRNLRLHTKRLAWGMCCWGLVWVLPSGAQTSPPGANAKPPAASASSPGAAPAELYFAPPPVPRFMLVPPDRPLSQQEMMQQIQEAQTRSLATQPPANKP